VRMTGQASATPVSKRVTAAFISFSACRNVIRIPA
jgi:hypothetical protein